METIQHATPVYATLEGRKEIRNSPKFKALGRLWDSSDNRSIRVIGPLMKLMKEHKPQTLDEWKQVYLTYGRSWEQIQEQAARWAITADLPIDEAIAHIVIHAIDETWEGANGEKIALELLRKNMPEYHFELAEDEVDTKYSIDIVVFMPEGGGYIGGIQVKPASYFNKNFANNKGQEDKARYYENNRRFIRDHGAVVYYMNTADIKRDTLRLIPLDEV
jgi:hypothetical protein